MFLMTFLWLVACFIVQVAFAQHGLDIASDPLAWIWVGTMWAGWAGCVWTATAFRSLWQRLFLLSIVGAWHVIWMSIGRDQDMLRYVLMFGGYGLTQPVAFRLLRIPSWEFGPWRLKSRATSQTQYAIVELLAITTVMAIFISGAKAYQPPGGETFWYGLPVVYLAFVTTATLCVLAIVLPSALQRQLFALGSLVSVAVGSMLIAWMENVVAPIPSSSWVTWWPYYGIQGVFAVWMVTLAACGSVTKTIPVNGQITEVKTPDLPRSTDDESPPSSDLLPFRRPPHK